MNLYLQQKLSEMPGESAIIPIPLDGGSGSGGVNINAYSNLSAGAG